MPPNIRHLVTLVEQLQGDDLYHGTSHAALLLIVAEDRMLGSNLDDNLPGISFTRNFNKAEAFARRAVGNAIEHGWTADPKNPHAIALPDADPLMLACAAERQVKGEDGVVLVFDRASLLRQFSAQIAPIEPGTDWGNDWEKQGDYDEEEERLATDDHTPDMLRHMKRLVIVDQQRYRGFKRFVLRHNKSFVSTFAMIERLVNT